MGRKEEYTGVYQYTDEMRKALQEEAQKVSRTPHKPALIPVREVKGKIHLVELREGVLCDTGQEIKARKVGEYSYIEEETYNPVARICREKGLKLNVLEIDTKILKFRYPDKDFDAYSVEPSYGLNIDALTRVFGGLYKIVR
jgi:hypothetical protein